MTSAKSPDPSPSAARPPYSPPQIGFGFDPNREAGSRERRTMAVVGRGGRGTALLLRAFAAPRPWPHAGAGARCIHEGPDTIEELLDRHLVKKPAAGPDEESAEARRRLTSSRREALALYRDILRAARLFAWTDDRGVPWREVLRANARREFEEARGERDPEVVARLLIGGRDAVQQALDRLAEASRRAIEAEEAKRRGGA